MGYSYDNLWNPAGRTGKDMIIISYRTWWRGRWVRSRLKLDREPRPGAACIPIRRLMEECNEGNIELRIDRVYEYPRKNKSDG